jgi:multiple sugar transport system ATP-binding protein
LARVTLQDIEKSYGDVAVVKRLNLAVADGELVVLVGASGCGKSTTLRMVAGLETISSGRLLFDDRVVNELSPRQRDIAMVFQSYALYPHMTVFENLAFGLRLRGMVQHEIDKRVADAAALLGLDAFLARKPAALSGGQRQRVAMGRAVVREPSAFLFDEPLSNLDAKLRVQMRLEIAKLHQRLGATMLYVTHDQVEAMTLADRIAVMHEGVLQQCASPNDIYATPANTYVATFIGSPAMNLWRVPKAHQTAAEVAVLGVRPQDLLPTSEAEATVRLRVEVVEPLGADTFAYGEAVDEHGHSLSAADALAEMDVATRHRAESASVVRLDPHTGVRPGELLPLTANPARLHKFDRTGNRVN